MTILVVGLYDELEDARQAVSSLKEAGFLVGDIKSIEDKRKDLAIAELVEMGVSEEEAQFYAEAVHDGRSLVLVSSQNEELADEARGILAQFDLSGYGGSVEPDLEAEMQEEDLYGLASADSRYYQQLEPEFRHHFDEHLAQDASEFHEYELAYRYGLSLAQAEPYSTLEWHQVEEDATRGWESYNKGTWHRFREAVRYGWDRLRQQERTPADRA